MSLFETLLLIHLFPAKNQINLEETKAQEISKLQETLHAMQLEVKEARLMINKERESAQKAIEEARPFMTQASIVVQDTEKVDQLTAEVERLKVNFI